MSTDLATRTMLAEFSSDSSASEFGSTQWFIQVMGGDLHEHGSWTSNVPRWQQTHLKVAIGC